MPASPDEQLLCDALDSADLGLIWVDETGHVRDASRNFMRWAGPAAAGGQESEGGGEDQERQEAAHAETSGLATAPTIDRGRTDAGAGGAGREGPRHALFTGRARPGGNAAEANAAKRTAAYRVRRGFGVRFEPGWVSRASDKGPLWKDREPAKVFSGSRTIRCSPGT